MTTYMQDFCGSDVYLSNNANYPMCKILDDEKNDYCKINYATHCQMYSRRIMLTKLAKLFF